MRIVVSAVGEYVYIGEGAVLNLTSLVIGTHSCGAEATLHIVSKGWRVLSCRSCNFRQLVPEGMIYPAMMPKFFEKLQELLLQDWSSPSVLLQVADNVMSSERARLEEMLGRV